jgi:hypothetical protein
MTVARGRVARGRLVTACTAAAAALAAAALAGVPSASASAASSVKGFSSSGIQFGGLTECENVFTGQVTADDGNGGIVASIDNVTIDCQSGTSVTPHLPWTLNLQRDRGYTIDGFDVDITTSQGTCRYAGTVRGDMQFPDGVYNLVGELTRQRAGCGGPPQLEVFALIEVVNTVN